MTVVIVCDRVGFLPSKKVFLPCCGRYGEKLPDVFILRCRTITTWRPEHIHMFVLGYN